MKKRKSQVHFEDMREEMIVNKGQRHFKQKVELPNRIYVRDEKDIVKQLSTVGSKVYLNSHNRPYGSNQGSSMKQLDAPVDSPLKDESIQYPYIKEVNDDTIDIVSSKPQSKCVSSRANNMITS